jgi:UDP-galactopyranose mutase
LTFLCFDTKTLYSQNPNRHPATVVNYPDGITRFTQKEFKTIKEAEAQRQKTIVKVQTDT